MRFALFYLFIPIVLTGSVLKAQERQFKQELERRVNRDEFPALALEQLEQLEGRAGKIRYYKETTGRVSTFEAKFWWNKSLWSLEFDSTGGFKDIEQTISNRTFLKLMDKAMHDELSRLGSPYRILKVQRQFSWKDQTNRFFIPEMVNPGHKGVNVRYELEIEVKTTQGRLVAYEVLLKEDGTLLRKREIVPPSDKHLLY